MSHDGLHLSLYAQGFIKLTTNLLKSAKKNENIVAMPNLVAVIIRQKLWCIYNFFMSVHHPTRMRIVDAGVILCSATTDCEVEPGEMTGSATLLLLLLFIPFPIFISILRYSIHHVVHHSSAPYGNNFGMVMPAAGHHCIAFQFKICHYVKKVGNLLVGPISQLLPLFVFFFKAPIMQYDFPWPSKINTDPPVSVPFWIE